MVLMRIPLILRNRARTPCQPGASVASHHPDPALSAPRAPSM